MNDKIKDVIKKFSFYDNEIVSEMNLKLDLGISSIDMVSLILDIEDLFCIEFLESDLILSELITVSDLERLVAKYI